MESRKPYLATLPGLILGSCLLCTLGIGLSLHQDRLRTL